MKEIYQITNISDLEKRIRKARLNVICLKNQIKNRPPNRDEIVEQLDKIQHELLECEKFEFVLEKRTIKD